MATQRRPRAAGSTGSPARPCGRSAGRPGVLAAGRRRAGAARGGRHRLVDGSRQRVRALEGGVRRRRDACPPVVDGGPRRGRGRRAGGPGGRQRPRACGRPRTARAATAPARRRGAGVVLGEADGHVRARDLATGRPLWSLRHRRARCRRLPSPTTTAASSSAPPTARFVSLDGDTGERALDVEARRRRPAAAGACSSASCSSPPTRTCSTRSTAATATCAWRAALPSRPLSGPVLFGDAVLVALPRRAARRDLPHRLRRAHRRAAGRLQGRRARPARRRCWSDDRLYLGMRDAAPHRRGLACSSARPRSEARAVSDTLAAQPFHEELHRCPRGSHCAVLTLAAPFVLVACGGGQSTAARPPPRPPPIGAGRGASATAGGAGRRRGLDHRQGDLRRHRARAGEDQDQRRSQVRRDAQGRPRAADGRGQGRRARQHARLREERRPRAPPRPPRRRCSTRRAACTSRTCSRCAPASRSRSGTATTRCTTSIPRPTKNAEFNIGQPRKGMETTKTFDKEEIMIPVGCDVHPWMRSYIAVLEPSVLRGHQGGRLVRDQEPARRRIRGRGRSTRS